MSCPRFFRNFSEYFPRVSVLHAAKCGVHVRIMRLEPVPERPPQHACSCARRAAFHHEMLSVKKISGISGIERECLETGEGRKRRARPLPAIPHKIGNAEIAVALRVGSRGNGIPALEIK